MWKTEHSPQEVMSTLIFNITLYRNPTPTPVHTRISLNFPARHSSSFSHPDLLLTAAALPKDNKLTADDQNDSLCYLAPHLSPPSGPAYLLEHSQLCVMWSWYTQEGGVSVRVYVCVCADAASASCFGFTSHNTTVLLQPHCHTIFLTPVGGCLQPGSSQNPSPVPRLLSVQV